MADLEKVIKAFEQCWEKEPNTRNCDDCPYEKHFDDGRGKSCVDRSHLDALELLKEQNWVKCSDRMPEERDTIFAKLKGTDKWKSAMFEKMSEDVRVVVVFEDGTRMVSHSHTTDGKWECEKHPLKRTVTHWMPNPELPEV